MEYLESIEIASDRLGPLSEETRKYFGDFESEEDFIAKVYDESKAPMATMKKDDSNKLEGRETPESQEEDEDDKKAGSAERDEKSLDKSEFFITDQDTENKMVQPVPE